MSFLIIDFVTDPNLDAVFLSETWLGSNNDWLLGANRVNHVKWYISKREQETDEVEA